MDKKTPYVTSSSRAAFALSQAAVTLAHQRRTRRPRGHKGSEGDLPDGPGARFLMDLVLHPERLWRKITRFIDGVLDAALPVVIGLLAVGLVALVAAALFVHLRNRRLSRGGHLLHIQPPPEIDERGAEVLWTGLHGLIRPRLKRWLLGQPALAWEVRAREDEVEVLLWVPDAIPASFVERALLSAWPGASITEAEATSWTPDQGSVAARQRRASTPRRARSRCSKEQMDCGANVRSEPSRRSHRAGWAGDRFCPCRSWRASRRCSGVRSPDWKPPGRAACLRPRPFPAMG